MLENFKRPQFDRVYKKELLPEALRDEDARRQKLRQAHFQENKILLAPEVTMYMNIISSREGQVTSSLCILCI